MPDKFIIIDDDERYNMLCDILIRHAFKIKSNVYTFTDAQDGVDYINNEGKNREEGIRSVLFLDINMPVLNGWDVLDLLEKADEQIRRNLTIFIISSSIDPKDKQKAINHPLVSDFIEKPLTIEIIEALFKN